MLEQAAFGAIAALLVGSAWVVVAGKNLVHCVLWLASMLIGTGVLFVLLGASFLGAIQVMLYAGGVVTLMLFAVMLTRRSSGVSVENEVAKARVPPAAVLSTMLFIAMVVAIANTELPTKPAAPIETRSIAIAFLTEHVLAFELLSVLLLAATIGAIVIARRRDKGVEPQKPTRTSRPVRGVPGAEQARASRMSTNATEQGATP